MYSQTSENFLLREIAGDNLLIPVNEAGVLNNTMITLNPTCTSIWKCYQKPHTMQEAIDEMIHSYFGNKTDIAKDICRFTSEALYYGLLKEVD